MKPKHTPEEIKSAKITALVVAIILIVCTADSWFNF